MNDSAEFVLTVRLWLRDGADVAEFEAFERTAAELMARYGGRIVSVVRHDGNDPFETHVVAFPSAAAFDAYRSDADVMARAAERDRLIERTEVATGSFVEPYT